MPSKSEAQRRLLYARFGADWVKRHHFDNKGKLPGHVSDQQRHLEVARRRRLHGKGKH